jgi:hypothetical protein
VPRSSFALRDAFWDRYILRRLIGSESTDVMAVTILIKFEGAVTGVILGAALIGTGGGVGEVVLSGVGAAMYTYTVVVKTDRHDKSELVSSDAVSLLIFIDIPAFESTSRKVLNLGGVLVAMNWGNGRNTVVIVG